MDPLLARALVIIAIISASAVSFVGAVAMVAAPIGRFLAAIGYPRLGEALIRLGADFKGAKEAAALPKGTPSISAQPLASVSEFPPAPGEPPRASSSISNSRFKPPPLPVLVCVSLMALAGCTSQQGDQALATIVDSMPVLNEALLRAYDRELDTCDGRSDAEACRFAVSETWEPVKVVMESIRRIWCAVAPEAKGCLVGPVAP